MIKKVELISFDAGTYTAVVREVGSLSVHLTGVPVARDIAAGEMIAGRYCVMAVFDEFNPGDNVIAGVFTP